MTRMAERHRREPLATRENPPCGSPPTPLNEGRGVNPGDTRLERHWDRMAAPAQRRPEREPRRHPRRALRADGGRLRSTKAGA